MWTFAIASVLVFIVAVLMTMVGKGGGNFYVVILAFLGIPMHYAATSGQFILFTASLAAMAMFQKNRNVSWPLALLVGSSTALSALAGGYFSHLFSGTFLKLIFAFMLFLSGLLMLLPIAQGKATPKKTRWTVVIKAGGARADVNLFLALPVTILTGFAAGMVGVSGGSFLVPLMVLACATPMHVAVGTASFLVASSAFMGFAGHAFRGDFRVSIAIPLAIAAIIGGLLGSRFSLKTKPKNLKKIFAYTNWLAGLFMIYNALRGRT